jgi:hypothetical protein
VKDRSRPRGRFRADALIPLTASPTPQYYDWSGIYVGANGGRSWSRTQGTVANFASDLTDQKLNGWLGGAQVGVNHQIGRVVLGLELSGAWANAKDTANCAVSHINIGSNLSCSAKQDWSAQLCRPTPPRAGRYGSWRCSRPSVAPNKDGTDCYLFATQLVGTGRDEAVWRDRR